MKPLCLLAETVAGVVAYHVRLCVDVARAVTR